MNEKNDSFDLLRIAGLKGRSGGPDKKYASFNRRMLAVTVDSVLLMLLIAPIVEVLFTLSYGPPPITLEELRRQMQMQPSQEEAAAYFWEVLRTTGFLERYVAKSLIQLLVLLGLTGWCWSKWSATPGKMLLRIKVVNADTEQPITTRQIFLRLLGYIVSGPSLVGIFWIGIDKRRQGWHDKIANTVVVVVPWNSAKERKINKKPLYKRILYGSILVCIWVFVFLPKKYFGLHLGAIEAGIFTLIWLWLFSKAVDLDIGFGSYQKPPEDENKDSPN